MAADEAMKTKRRREIIAKLAVDPASETERIRIKEVPLFVLFKKKRLKNNHLCKSVAVPSHVAVMRPFIQKKGMGGQGNCNACDHK